MPELASPKPYNSSSSGEFQFSPRVVLFATDFSNACDNASSYALALANEYQSKLLLAHVIDPNVFVAVPAEMMDRAREQVRSDAQAQLKRLQQRNGFSQLNSESLLREGGISETLLGLIEDYEVELLVTGTRGHGPTERLLLGSVAEKLFRQARCPVLVVPEQAAYEQKLSIHRILCPIDFSPDSPAAIAVASSIARHYGAELILAHVLEEPAPDSEKQKQELVDSAKERLRLLRADRNLPFDSRTEVIFGVPAEGIARIASDYQADLVVLSVHEAAAAVAHEQERTAYQIIRWSHSPIITIPRFHSTRGSRSGHRSISQKNEQHQ